jgi:hypothetical protein
MAKPRCTVYRCSGVFYFAATRLLFFCRARHWRLLLVSAAVFKEEAQKEQLTVKKIKKYF